MLGDSLLNSLLESCQLVVLYSLLLFSKDLVNLSFNLSNFDFFVLNFFNQVTNRQKV